MKLRKLILVATACLAISSLTACQGETATTKDDAAIENNLSNSSESTTTPKPEATSTPTPTSTPVPTNTPIPLPTTSPEYFNIMPYSETAAYLVYYKGSEEVVHIPSVIDEYSITYIYDSAFSGHSELNTVILPDSIAAIGLSAFSDCTGLTSITIPERVTDINNYAFENCTGLKSITLPSGLIIVGPEIFTGCTNLESLILPDWSNLLDNTFMYRLATNCPNVTVYTSSEDCFDNLSAYGIKVVLVKDGNFDAAINNSSEIASSPTNTPTPTPTSTPTPTPEAKVTASAITDNFIMLENVDTSYGVAIGGGVIINGSETGIGAMNYYGEIIVPYEYSSCEATPTKDGYFCLSGEYYGENYVFDCNGNLVYSPYGSIEFINGHYVVSKTFSDDFGPANLVIYNLLTGESVEIAHFSSSRFCYSPDLDYFLAGFAEFYDDIEVLFKIYYDGTYERVESEGYDIPSETSLVCNDYYTSDESGFSLININTGEAFSMPYLELMRLANAYKKTEGYYYLDKETVPYVEYGNIFNYGTLINVSYSGGYESYNSSSSALFSLVDVSKYNEESPLDCVINCYTTLELNKCGIFLAAQGDDFFYVDSTGETIKDYFDCSGFRDGYALAMKEDAMVYIIDTAFNETPTGLTGDYVCTIGNGFAISNNEVYTLLLPVK